MRKEQIIAIILGVVLGVTVAFGIWRAVRQKPEQTPQTVQDQSASNQASAGNGEFTIVSPPPNAASISSTTVISGYAPGGSIIVASGEDTHITKVNEAGEFSIEVKLVEGINTVNVWLVEKDKSPQNKTVNIVYASRLEEDPSRTAESVTGTVTDIAGGTVQLRTASGEIEQLLVGGETSYVMIGKETRELGFEDLAIGDFVAALGYKNSGGVLEIGRMVVTVEPAEPDVVMATGAIQTLSRNEFIVLTPESEEISIDATNSAQTYSAAGTISTTRLATAEPGDFIAVLGTFKNQELVATTIILL